MLRVLDTKRPYKMFTLFTVLQHCAAAALEDQT